jgi:hypothetical protein
MTIKAIKVNGAVRKVTNYFSSGPGTPVREYELGPGECVYKIGDQWWLQCPGQFKRAVTVEAV